MPCSTCGASVARAEADRHVCDPKRRLDFELFQLRHEIGAFEWLFREYLASPRGRFESWLAERRRQHPS